MATEYILGLDWDGTVSDYKTEFALLASRFDSVVIITLNNQITPQLAAATLNLDQTLVSVEICPDLRLDDYGHWKTEICRKHSIVIMFDDDRYVIGQCRSSGIAVIGVRANRFNT